MTNAPTKTVFASAKERVRKDREVLRTSGLRPVTLWVPDTHSAEFVAAYQKQIQALAKSVKNHAALEAEYWQWAESTQTDEGWV